MTEKRKSRLEQVLNVFTEIRPGEGLDALLLALNIFLIFTAYYIIKPVREALILSQYSANEKAYASAGMAVLLLIFIPIYSGLASRMCRRKLISRVTIFFMGCMVLFYILMQAGLRFGVTFYLWVGIFNLMIPAQFWAFANDLYTPESGKRIFVIVAFGASAGAVTGGIVTDVLISAVGIPQLLLLSAAILFLGLILTNTVDSRHKKPEAAGPSMSREQAEKPLERGNAFKAVFQNRYLLMIAFMVMILNWVNTSGEFILSRIVTETAHRAAENGELNGFSISQFIGHFYAHYFSGVNVLGLLLQLFLVSRVLKYIGVRYAIMILPLIALGGYVTIGCLPVLGMIRMVKTAENATDYSLNNTVRHTLLLPATREEKYKAKQVIDSFFHRAGDVLSAAVVFAGTHWLAFQTRHFACVNIVLVLIWLALAWAIGRENKRLTA